MGRVGWRRTVLSLIFALSGAVPAVAAAGDEPAEPAAPAAPALRILIVGDSLTQGWAGDWTWRYRLWEHLTDSGANAAAVDFVGPRDDLRSAHRRGGSQAYLDADFDRDHAARWGMSLAFQDWDVVDLIAEYQPDVVVELLGTNDLTYLEHSPRRVARRTRTFVERVRSADPDISLVLGHVAATWYDGVRAFNRRLDSLAESLDQPTSPVRVARIDRGFKRKAHTWDGSHPNSRGEVLIAAAVADALAELGVAEPFARPLAKPKRGPRRAPRLRVRPVADGLALTWRGPPGADREFVWLRNLTKRGRWQRLPYAVPGRSWELDGLGDGSRYAVKLQPARGTWAAAPDIRSNVVRRRTTPSVG